MRVDDDPSLIIFGTGSGVGPDAELGGRGPSACLPGVHVRRQPAREVISLGAEGLQRYVINSAANPSPALDKPCRPSTRRNTGMGSRGRTSMVRPPEVDVGAWLTCAAIAARKPS